MADRHGKEYVVLDYEGPPTLTAIGTYFQFAILIIFGRLRDFLHRYGFINNHLNLENDSTRDFVPLLEHNESFFTRNLYRRAVDSLNRPLRSAPSAEFEVMERKSEDYWSWELTGKTIKAINLGSYNYLGFAENSGYCVEQSATAIRDYGVSASSPRQEVGTLAIHRELEANVAEFVGKEDAITFGMGFATNSLNLPALVGPDCCVISDILNHASLVLGIRLSGAEVKRFKHNDMNALEECLRKAIIHGQKRTRRPFRKLLIVVEGIYSMEGSIVNLPGIIELKKKYKAHLFVDEAHSIGALGPRGRGVVDYFGCNPADVDILMGTFSKSFGAAGGYIAASNHIIKYLRARSHASCYGSSMPPVVAQQVLASMMTIVGRSDDKEEGPRRLRQLAWNCRYFRRRLHKMKFIVYGHPDSPVVPVMLFKPANFSAFSRMTLEKGLGVVVVGFPAAPLLLCRVRFCLSACHTKEMLDRALEIVGEIGKELRIRISRWPLPEWCKEPIECSPCEERKLVPKNGKITTYDKLQESDYLSEKVSKKRGIVSPMPNS